MTPAKTISILAPETPPGTKTIVSQIPARGLPADARIVSAGRGTTVVAASLLDGSELRIRQFAPPRLLGRCIYGWWRGSKARRTFHNALRLGRLNIYTPTPYGFLEIYTSGGLMNRSYYLARQLPADFSDLHGAPAREDFEQLVEALGAFIGRLHRKGVWIKNLSPDNVLVRATRDAETDLITYRFAIIDPAAVDFDVTDLRKLIRSCAALFDDAEALLLFAVPYAATLGIDAPRAEDLILERYRKAHKPGLFRRLAGAFRNE